MGATGVFCGPAALPAHRRPAATLWVVMICNNWGFTDSDRPSNRHTGPFSLSRVLSEFSRAKPSPEAPEGQLGCSPQPPRSPVPPAPTHGAHQQLPPDTPSPSSARPGDGAGGAAPRAGGTASVAAPRCGSPGRGETRTASGSEAEQAVRSPTAQCPLSPLLGCPVSVTGRLLSTSSVLCFLTSRSKGKGE